MQHLALLFPHLLECPEWFALILLFVMAAVLVLMREGRQAAEGAALLARLYFAGAVVFGGMVLLAGSMRIEIAAYGPAKLAFLVDPLSVTLLALVSFLGLVVTRFSIHYLDGDPGQARFSRWLVLTLSCVLILAVSSNLLMFTLAWIGTSLCLHQLLTFYRERPAALLAARKKFYLSRLADLCMLGALVLVWQGYGTWEFHELFAHPVGPHSGGIAGLFVAAATLKSAQFPFHSWLPDTLETPTPVSALMHAGIINAGGFLIVRLSPLIIQSPTALNVLALTGAVTALLGSVVMMTQTSIKKSLAWSTVAQMGFMMLQCGLGAFALAIMHLVAHSLYKAHAFLSSGSVVGMVKSAWTPVGRPAAHPWVILGALVAAGVIGIGVALSPGLKVEMAPGRMLLVAVFIMALAHLLWTLWSSSLRGGLVVRGLLLALATTVACFAIHGVFEQWLHETIPAYMPPRGSLEYGMMALLALFFFAVLFLQTQLPTWGTHPTMARLYVHASNGFYLGAIFNRLIQKIIA
ncbi:proton-conducting transporter transmembrane domain-containing protein [Prosthecobacter dejongeii]|uniref:Probable inorganic carbon transporter subunit DabB n=1 Tax=Prosthecobacter dejongeii TaxID=48465 RepID=A0A7W8DP74_9BACT|nr:proton-conducting transporter membrane subunit [Prosthecobacter dejongeii]MBB5037354.1 NAD(P)H-quinone oxidoreductase subunit 5 [Prosthecobacter dejongeii]